jgi:predicted nucleic acid-binding protein
LNATREPTGVSRLALYELYVGAVRSTDPAETPEAADAALAWSETLEFTAAAAREAATIRAGLLDPGTQMGAADAVVAGTAREADAELVTLDTDFERVPDLSVRVLTRPD